MQYRTIKVSNYPNNNRKNISYMIFHNTRTSSEYTEHEIPREENLHSSPKSTEYVYENKEKSMNIGGE